ncbi:GNAT family N-acetyltransferase [Paenibacillus albus]|uniref:GNAT family N-acetyltransferase n=1 Tax=Paenibacillus albus TaxID=2495582 RepID=UPI0013DEF64F|nr:GNAT family N-acetyltransferase [Paenibacillus albus]
MRVEEEALQKWAEFNRRKWNCKAELMTFRAEGTEAECTSLFFMNRSGKLFLPPLNYYNHVVFKPTPTSKNYKLTRQWLRVAEQMTLEMTNKGCTVDFVFPPEINDVRPWRWANYQLGVKYSYRIKLPYEDSASDTTVRKRIEKANALGYVSRQADRMEDVHVCLIETAKRKGFKQDLTVEDLELMRSILGDDIFKAYVCYSKDGEPVSASVELVLSKECALGLMLGTKKEHLQSGVAYQMTAFMLQDMAALGVEQYDFCGANIPSVAESKSKWGAELVPYFTVRKRSFKDWLREARSLLYSLSAVSSLVGLEVL